MLFFFHLAPPKPPPLFYPASSYLAIDGGCLCNDSICIYEAMKTDLYDTSTADLLQLAFFTTIPFFDSVRITTNVNFTIFNTTENSNVVVTWYTNGFLTHQSVCCVRCFLLLLEVPWTPGLHFLCSMKSIKMIILFLLL